MSCFFAVLRCWNSWKLPARHPSQLCGRRRRPGRWNPWGVWPRRWIKRHIQALPQGRPGGNVRGEENEKIFLLFFNNVSAKYFCRHKMIFPPLWGVCVLPSLLHACWYVRHWQWQMQRQEEEEGPLSNTSIRFSRVKEKKEEEVKKWKDLAYIYSTDSGNKHWHDFLIPLWDSFRFTRIVSSASIMQSNILPLFVSRQGPSQGKNKKDAISVSLPLFFHFPPLKSHQRREGSNWQFMVAFLSPLLFFCERKIAADSQTLFFFSQPPTFSRPFLFPLNHFYVVPSRFAKVFQKWGHGKTGVIVVCLSGS